METRFSSLLLVMNCSGMKMASSELNVASSEKIVELRGQDLAIPI